MKSKLLLAGVAGLAIMQSFGTAFAQSGEVTIAAYDGIFQTEYMDTVIKGFQEAYPDITVNYYPMTNSAATLGTLRAQKSAPQVDVVILDVSVAKAATDEGLLAELDRETVTNLNDLYDTAFTEGVNAAAVTFDNLVMLYNTKAITEAPTSWEALWDPAYEGRVVIPAAPDIQGIAMTIIANQLAGGTVYTDGLDAGVTKMGELAPSVQTWEPTPDPYQPIMNAQADIGIGWNARGQIFSDQSDGSMGVVIPTEGSVFQINVIGTVEGSANNEAAKTFMNYALSPEAQAAFTERMFYAPTNEKAAPAAEALERTAATPERMETMLGINWLEVAQFREALTERWRREVIALSR
jgi:putative spermidine/putrescine transport system substrate-binding protein